MIRVIVKKPGEDCRHACIQDDLKSKQELVYGYIQVVPGSSLGLPDGVDMYVNEEGKARSFTPNLSLWGGKDQAWGPVFFCSVDYETGENRSLRSDEQAAVFEFCSKNSLLVL